MYGVRVSLRLLEMSATLKLWATRTVTAGDPKEQNIAASCSLAAVYCYRGLRRSTAVLWDVCSLGDAGPHRETVSLSSVPSCSA